MYIRNTIYRLQFIFSVVVLGIFFLFYVSYENTYEKNLEDYVSKEISFNKLQIKNSLNIVNSIYLKQKNTFLNIHKEALITLKENENINLNELRKKLLRKYNLRNTKLEFYLINKKYTIYKTTYLKDLGFNLGIIPEARVYLDKTKKDGKIYLAESISEDALDGKYKLYSYSKIKENKFLELGFIDNEIFNNTYEHLYENKNLSIFRVITNKDYQFYYEKRKNLNISKNKHFKNLPKFHKDKRTNDSVINSIRQSKKIEIIEDKILTVYLPLLEYKEFNLLGYTDIVMKLKIDISDKMQELEKFEITFVLLFTFIVLFLIFMFYWISKSFTKPMESMTKSIKNGNKIDLFNKTHKDSELAFISKEYNNLLDSLKDEIKKNRELSYFDELTNTYNRKAYNQKISEYISLFERYNNSFSLILFDIDDFKKINDTYGHDMGDRVLVDLTKLINDKIRGNDSLYRIGGEEFIIVLPQTKIDKAQIVAKKIRKEVEENLNTIKNKNITISMGLTQVKDNDTKESIYKRADELMYQSKIKGKNQISIQKSEEIHFF